MRMTRKDEAFKVVWPAIEVFPSMLTDEVSLKEQANYFVGFPHHTINCLFLAIKI